MSNPLNYSKVSRGSPMQTHRVGWRIVPFDGPGRPEGSYKLETSDIPEIRRMLRTDMPLDQIAAQLAVGRQALSKFIKRRQICNLKARNDFHKLQKSLARLDD